MNKNYVYVLVYDCGGKQVIIATSGNYAIIQRKKHAYDARLGKEGKIKKLTKSS